MENKQNNNNNNLLSHQMATHAQYIHTTGTKRTNEKNEQ